MPSPEYYRLLEEQVKTNDPVLQNLMRILIREDKRLNRKVEVLENAVFQICKHLHGETKIYKEGNDIIKETFNYLSKLDVDLTREIQKS